MHLQEFHSVVNATLPPAAAVDGDAIGMQVASRRQSASNVLVTMEVTDEVLQEALDKNCDAILTFHPLIYAPLRAIDRKDRVGRLVSELIRHDMALMVVHTSFDAFPQGTNAILAEKLHLDVVDSLADSAVPGFGMGVLAKPRSEMAFMELVDRIGELTKAPVRYAPSPRGFIDLVAIVAGSGMSYYNDALGSGADVFITADVKYHAFHAAQDAIGLIDPGHYEMERFVPEGIHAALRPRLGTDVQLHVSTVNTNPVRYHSPLTLEHSTQQQDHL